VTQQAREAQRCAQDVGAVRARGNATDRHASLDEQPVQWTVGGQHDRGDVDALGLAQQPDQPLLGASYDGVREDGGHAQGAAAR
jgi:hypothetical protein